MMAGHSLSCDLYDADHGPWYSANRPLYFYRSDEMSEDAISRDAALALVGEVEKAFGDQDIDVIMAGFTDDVVVRFADQPELHGKDAVRELLEARFARQRGYRLKKQLRMLDGNMVGNYWDGEWEDAQTGKAMVGRGTEFWTIRDGRVSRWEAAFNVWERDAPPRPPCT